MENNQNWVCAVSGQPIEIGDRYVTETIHPQSDGQLPYDRYVKEEYFDVSSEGPSVKRTDGIVRTRTE